MSKLEVRRPAGSSSDSSVKLSQKLSKISRSWLDAMKRSRAVMDRLLATKAANFIALSKIL